MAEIFRIETDHTSLSWSDRSSSERAADPSADGRLAITLLEPSVRNVKIWRRGLADNTGNNVEVKVGPRLFEETHYDLLLHGNGQRQVEIRHRDPLILAALHSLAGGSIVHGEINFRNEIGRSRFSVYAEGKAQYEFEVSVFPTKLDYAADYNVLLADTEDILTGLVLEYLRSTLQFGFASGEQHPSRLELVLSLRNAVKELEHGLHYIEQHPHHNLIRKRVQTRAEKLRRPDATLAKMIAQGKGQGPKTRTASGLVLRRRLPELRARVTWDTPEHRWLAAQLIRIRRRLAEIHLVEQKRRTENRLRQLRTLEEIAELEDRVAALQSLDPIAHAKGAAPPGFTSLTLQTRPGYREAYHACLVLLQRLRVDGGAVPLSAKDTDCLYEYWCYLALVRTIARLTGEQLSVRELFSIERSGLRLRLKRGTSQTVKFSNGDRTLELTYNPQYANGTFILPQKPDVVLTFNDPGRRTLRLIFDTRYEINPEPSYVSQFGSPGPPPESIDVLHRYRDSFLEQTGLQGSRSETRKRTVVEGVTLFPYTDTADQFRGSQLWLSLQEFGIGAIPFLPTETKYVEEWLRVVLHREGWATVEESASYRPHDDLHAWHDAEKEPVLIAALQQNASERLEWIKLTRCYFTPVVQTQTKQQWSRWVAIYSPADIRQPEAITHLAEVEDFALKLRREIETPWPAQRSPDEVQVVYRLGEVRELERPIENRGPRGLGRHFTKNRWTSRLGIMRATQLREVLMETSAEWRLYEQLRIAGVEFTLRPATANSDEENDIQGKTWFVSKRLRVQYRGAAGFLIRRAGVRDEYKSDLETVVERFIASPS